MSPTETPFWKRIAEGVRVELARQRIDQGQLAAAIGRSRNYTSTRVNGHAPFKLDEIEAAANFLRVDLDTLAGKVAP
ncbi:helix-turn-helix domain-containing protein [Microbacterium sp. A1-JK]|uniref:helix-turn-helix domain-containing protein n=1 Tax=Microbacterium sp. A1-JK TaxID=3177516 RepID=UPI0038874A4E